MGVPEAQWERGSGGFADSKLDLVYTAGVISRELIVREGKREKDSRPSESVMGGYDVSMKGVARSKTTKTVYHDKKNPPAGKWA